MHPTAGTIMRAVRMCAEWSGMCLSCIQVLCVSSECKNLTRMLKSYMYSIWHERLACLQCAYMLHMCTRNACVWNVTCLHLEFMLHVACATYMNLCCARGYFFRKLEGPGSCWGGGAKLSK
jgi:hypothetical protein